jgi:hypothetical protein
LPIWLISSSGCLSHCAIILWPALVRHLSSTESSVVLWTAGPVLSLVSTCKAFSAAESSRMNWFRSYTLQLNCPKFPSFEVSWNMRLTLVHRILIGYFQSVASSRMNWFRSYTLQLNCPKFPTFEVSSNKRPTLGHRILLSSYLLSDNSEKLFINFHAEHRSWFQ